MVDRSSSEIRVEKRRCSWAGATPHMIRYHDSEWGRPVHDDRRLFEMLLLEGAQAGLSWDTVLRRREGYRQAFAGFDPVRIARFDRMKKSALLRDTRIIRNRLKIAAAVTNARAFLRGPTRLRIIRRLSLAVRGRAADRQPVEAWHRHSCQDPAERSALEGSQTARVSVRRQHDRLCVHAGGGYGE